MLDTLLVVPETPSMIISARRAERSDLPALSAMYGELAEEQQAIREIWPHTDGLNEPIEGALSERIGRDDAVVVVGEIDGSALGFLVAVEEPLLVPMSDRRVGVITLIYTEHEARGVGVGSSMLRAAMAKLVGRGIDLFDARVSPGHRMAKNFFESNGFKARSITMHRSDEAATGDDGNGAAADRT